MSAGAPDQSNRAARRAIALTSGRPPTSDGHAKKSDSTTPCSPVALYNSLPFSRSSASLSASLRISNPNDACTTIPITVVRYVCRTNRSSASSAVLAAPPSAALSKSDHSRRFIFIVSMSEYRS